MAKEQVQKILAAGANVVFTTKGIDDLCLRYFVEKGCMGVRRCRKEDLQRLAKATGGTLVSTLANLEGEESFDPSYLGNAEEVSQIRVSDDELVIFPSFAPFFCIFHKTLFFFFFFSKDRCACSWFFVSHFARSKRNDVG